MTLQSHTIKGKVAGYRSASSQARMRQKECELKGDTVGAKVWEAKAEHWKKLAAEWTAKLKDAM